MKFTLTGSLGNTSKPLAEILIAAGHQVTIITSSADRVAAIEALGATAAVGSVTDVDFLSKAFTGADAIYTMIPPNMGAPDYLAYMREIAGAYVTAIRNSGVLRVVNLSSIGADLAAGTGPIAGLHEEEEMMQALEGVAVKHVRAGFFFTNFYGNMDMIKHAGILGSNYGSDAVIMAVHPNDIAVALAEELQTSFTGKSVRYIISDEQQAGDIARVLGTAVGKPDLPWIEFSDEEAYNGMTGAGLSEEMARMYTEMGSAVRSGRLFAHYLQNRPASFGKTKLVDFAKEFAKAY